MSIDMEQSFRSIPFFSVIVPTYQRLASLKSCLAALSQLNYPRDRFEVIVVNDGDRSLPNDVIAPYRRSLSIQLLFQENAGPASARNAGALRAKGQFLAFTDDDCMVAPDWLSQLAKSWQLLDTELDSKPDNKPDNKLETKSEIRSEIKLQTKPQTKTDSYLLGGHIANALTNNLYATASQLHNDAVYAYFNQAPCQATFIASCNFSVSRIAYQRIGGFDERFPIAAAEDREFCDRALRKGYGAIYLPAAKVYHAHYLTLRSFLKQHFNYGRGAFFFHQSRQKAVEQKAAVPIKTDFKFYWHLLTYPFQPPLASSKQDRRQKLRTLHRALLLSVLFIGCNLAKTVGFYWERLQHLFSPTAFNSSLPPSSSLSR